MRTMTTLFGLLLLSLLIAPAPAQILRRNRPVYTNPFSDACPDGKCNQPQAAPQAAPVAPAAVAKEERPKLVDKPAAKMPVGPAPEAVKAPQVQYYSAPVYEVRSERRQPLRNIARFVLRR